MYAEPRLPCNVLYAIDEWSKHKVYVTDAIPEVSQLKRWSESHKGNVFRSRTTLVHTAGTYSETYIKEYRISQTTGERVHLPTEYGSARQAAIELTGRNDIGWTPGKIARNVSNWLRLRNTAVNYPRRILPEYNYYHCSPKQSTHGTLWDMSGAYWQVAMAVPSPRVCFTTSTTNRLLFGWISAEQERRWKAMLTSLASYKSIRLAIVGQYTSGWSESNNHPDDGPFKDTQNWHINSGKVVRTPALYGPLNPLGLLIVRCVYELCQEQTERMDGAHAYVDGFVSCDIDTRCSYWDSMGVRYKAKASGKVDVRSLTKRKVGDYSTAQYRDWQERSRIYQERTGHELINGGHTQPYYGRRLDPQLYYHPLFMGR